MMKRCIVVVFLLTSMELIVISNSSLLHFDTNNKTSKVYREEKSNSLKYKSPHLKTVYKRLIKGRD